ncbi:MAG: hypothetical protein EZS28_008182 [Streblomastix strix]|uniref:Uncharacterized protein n=1 Tax=Streblomastix strix TaxID=222440 RepID=A0A5J4WQ64_9EUKA|nr:MAG: hypothetical protein EZS28_008182 [Streblomastix strix]
MRPIQLQEMLSLIDRDAYEDAAQFVFEFYGIRYAVERLYEITSPVTEDNKTRFQAKDAADTAYQEFPFASIVAPNQMSINNRNQLNQVQQQSSQSSQQQPISLNPQLTSPPQAISLPDTNTHAEQLLRRLSDLIDTVENEVELLNRKVIKKVGQYRRRRDDRSKIKELKLERRKMYQFKKEQRELIKQRRKVEMQKRRMEKEEEIEKENLKEKENEIQQEAESNNLIDLDLLLAPSELLISSTSKFIAQKLAQANSGQYNKQCSTHSFEEISRLGDNMRRQICEQPWIERFKQFEGGTETLARLVCTVSTALSVKSLSDYFAKETAETPKQQNQ